VAAQAAESCGRCGGGKTPTLIDELTVLCAPLLLADKHLGQLNYDDARVAKYRYIPDLSTDIPVDRSLLPRKGVYSVSALVAAAVNVQLLRLLIQRYLIDPLPLSPKISLWMPMSIYLCYVEWQEALYKTG
jgi:hypothetical protein